MNYPSERVRSLLASHKDQAQFSCTGDKKVFWVLDLEDSMAFVIAKVFRPEKENAEWRDRHKELGAFPAMTIASGMDMLNGIRKEQGMKEVETPHEDTILMAIVSENHLFVVKGPSMKAVMAAG